GSYSPRRLWERGRPAEKRGGAPGSGDGARGAAREPARRPLEPVVLAQRRPLLLAAEEAALLEDRDDLVAKDLELVGDRRRHVVEAVGGAVHKPGLEVVGHLLGRPHHRAVTAPAGEPADH